MLDTSKTYTSEKYGNFNIVSYIKEDDVTVKFSKTGYVVNVRACQVVSGLIKDKLSPSVCGVGFIGDGRHKSSIKGKSTAPYKAWGRMMERCYCPKRQVKQPTYKGCSVVNDWHNFQNFADWFELNYIKGYQLDKDILVNGNKVYSPEFCMFVSNKDNMVKAHAKNYIFKSPSGYIVNVYNLNEFCRTNSLKQGGMSKVSLGTINSYKGWTRG